MLKIKNLSFMSLMLFLTACVTINIYFPAAAAEEAARTIVRDVLDKTPAEAPSSDNKASFKQTSDSLILLGYWLDQLVPAAHAAQANINIDSPAIQRLSKTMNQRHGAMRAHFASGALGFGKNGLVIMRDANAVSLRDRNTVKKLIADENADRNALYREIARANGHPEWEGQVRSTFAKVWVDEAPKGYWYQNAKEQWVRR